MKLVAVLFVLACTACSSSSAVDPAVALPGRWNCAEITLELFADGRYTWGVPAGSGAGFAPGTPVSDQLKVNADGSYALLGQWRLDNGSLALDMLGATEKYSLQMDSATSMVLNGPDRYACSKS